jgi:hypothetical protein
MIFPTGLLELAAGAAGAAALNLDFGAIDPCPKGSPEDIVVCGSRDRRSPYRLPKLTHDRKGLHPEKVIPGGRIHLESKTRPDGLVDKRIMITFSLPL